MPARPDLEVPRLSGVGVHREDNDTMNMDPLVVPSYYHARWDNKGFPDADKLQLIRHGPNNNGGYASILHASCCSLLGEYFYPDPIPVARLVELCKSCSVQHST